MAINIPLKVAILESGLTQRDLARLSGLHENYISMLVRGRLNPNEAEKQKISAVVGKEPQHLFGNNGKR